MTAATLTRERPKSGRPGRTVGRHPNIRPATTSTSKAPGQRVHPAAVTRWCTACGLERGELCFGRTPDGGRIDICRDCQPTSRGGA